MVKPATRISALKWANKLAKFVLFVMPNYLTEVWGINLTHAAGIINIWNGLSKILPAFFLFLVDAFLGHFMMLVISSVAYSVGISFVVMSTIPYHGTCKKYEKDRNIDDAQKVSEKYEKDCIDDAQKVIFYIGMALIATARAGYAVSVRHFRKQQSKKVDKNISNTASEVKNKSGKRKEQPENADVNTSNPASEEKNKSGKDKEQAQNADKNTSTANCLKSIPLVLLVLNVIVIGAIQLVYKKGEKKGEEKEEPWSIMFGIPAICTLVATFLFFSGWPSYKKVEPNGSPITNVCRVFVAFFLKRSEEHPRNATSLYRKDNKESFTPTRFLRRLEKATIILPDDHIGRNGQVNNKWKLCSVSEVEEAKIMVRMVPMWLTFIVCGIVSSNGNTYFMEQANHMNRNIGKWKVPLLVLVLLFKCVKRTLGRLVNKYFLGKPSVQNTKDSRAPAYLNDKKFRPALGIGIAMVFSVLCCITDAKIESKRLKVIRKAKLLDKPHHDIPMSVYWLLFQFFLLSGLDAFSKNSIAAFYTYQGPKSMKHYLRHFGKFVFGLGFMFSVLSVDVVGKISKKVGKKNWFQSTLNKSQLDRYYWFLAGLSSVNLVIYTVVACFYRFKNIEKDMEGADADTGGAEKELRLKNDHKKVNMDAEVSDSNAGRPH